MGRILERVPQGEYARLEDFFDPGEGRMGLVVSFIAVLELVPGVVSWWFLQNELLAPIHIKIKS
ncbi:MAG: hypothetical protein Ct9H300mP16_07720 [Pseudomonadota bacterium]|nr:MAG: hypothetical protein Ct9H300mP16_07720 [Pseudomonadota bacterium]